MSGWPVTLSVRDNYARKPVGYLPTVSVDGIDRPVLRVSEQATGDLVYAIRLTTPTVRPWIFADGAYKVELGVGNWMTWTDVTPVP